MMNEDRFRAIEQITKENINRFNDSHQNLQMSGTLSDADECTYDYRLQMPEFEEKSFSFSCISMKDGRVFGTSSIYYIDTVLSEGISFWALDPHGRLEKKNLKEVFTVPCFTLGFGKIYSDRLSVKYHIMKWKLDMVREIIQKTSLPLYIEITGTQLLDPNNETAFRSPEVYQALGKIHEDSTPMKKLVHTLGLKESGLFERHTVGPVYMSSTSNRAG